jgi:hypothetical protein
VAPEDAREAWRLERFEVAPGSHTLRTNVRVGRRDRLFFDSSDRRPASCGRPSPERSADDALRPSGARRKIKSLEHQGDELAHRVFNESARVFATPLDREDLHALASSLDDVLDNIDAAAARLILYKITAPIPSCVELSKILIEQTEILRDNVGKVLEREH